MPTINEAIWNYASNLSSPETIIKSYSNYLRSGVTKAKEMISVFQLRANNEITAQEVSEKYGDSVYYYNTHVMRRSDLINNAAAAIELAESDNDFVNYELISFNQDTLDGDTISINLGDLKNSLVNDLDTVYYSSVLFASSEPLLNNNLSTSEKILAKSQICSEALSQIPNADSEKISQLQDFVDSVANSTYDQQSILNLLFDFCGFSSFNTVTKDNIEHFITDLPVVELDNYTGQSPINGFVNSVTDTIKDVKFADVIDFAVGVTIPVYGAFKLFKSIRKYAPKVLGSIGDQVVDFGANIITDITNTALDPVDFNLDRGEHYSMCANGFNFGGTGMEDRVRIDVLSGDSPEFTLVNNTYSGKTSGPTTFNTIFGAVSVGYSPNYDCSFGVTKLKPFNFLNYSNLTFDDLYNPEDLNYFQLQQALLLTKPASDFRANSDDYQLRNRLLNGTYVSAVCLPLMYLPIYYYIKLLNKFAVYDVDTDEGRLFYSQLYNALFVTEWDGSIYPVNVGDVLDGEASALLQGVGKLLVTCSKLLVKCCQAAALGALFTFNEQIEILNYIIKFDITIQFKAYDSTPFNNTHAILASTSTPMITRSGMDPTTVTIKYVSNDTGYTMFKDGYITAGGFNPADTLYDQFFFIANLLSMNNEAIKSFVYLPYSHGTMPEPTYHIATDKENVENFNHAISVVTFSIISIIIVTMTAKYLIKAKRSLLATQAAIQVKKQSLGQAVLTGDSLSVNQLTKELTKLRKKERYLNFLGSGSLATAAEVVISNQNDEVVDSVCSYVNTKIGV